MARFLAYCVTHPASGWAVAPSGGLTTLSSGVLLPLSARGPNF